MLRSSEIIWEINLKETIEAEIKRKDEMMTTFDLFLEDETGPFSYFRIK